MKSYEFESKLMPNGHLFIPEKFKKIKNVHYKVIVLINENNDNVTNEEIELSALNDISDDFLNEDEVKYYFNLKEL